MKMKMQNVIRKDSLSKFGFGSEAMKRLSVCQNCRSLEKSENVVCSICKKKLVKLTLYDIYVSKHRACQECGCVVADGMHFCPQCGMDLNQQKTACTG